MTNINTAIRFRPNAIENPNLVDLSKKLRKADNGDFLAEVAKGLQAASKTPGPAATTIDPGGVGCFGLMGEYGLLGYGIRRAEEIIRVDRTPSYWSHAFLVTSALATDPKRNRDAKNSAWIWESTLEPATLFNHFVDRNGVAARRIADYTRADFDLFGDHSVPNMAIIAIGLTPAERKAVIDRADDPDVDQLRYDLSGLLGTWYAYLTGRATHPNPLSTGSAIYCSAYVQLAYDAVGIDLAPSAHQRNTSPEHLWQMAKYFYDALRVTNPATGQSVPRPVIGWYCARDAACVIAPVSLELPRTIRELTRSLES